VNPRLRRSLRIGLSILVVAGSAFAASPNLQPDEGKAGITRHVVLDRMPDAPVCSPNPLSLRFRASGASDDGEQGSANRKEATSVHCTNFSTGNAEIEVQVIQWDGLGVFCGVVTAPAGRTFTFSTQNTTIYFDDVILNGSPGTPAIFQGSVLIWSDSPQVRCTAQVLDPINYPPIFVTGLELYP
jgi:hypothetical protein